MASRNQKATIKDIARHCGTSIATVSRVLSGSSYPVKEELSRRIIQAAKQLDYQPNVYGRMLKGARSSEVGILVPNVSDPFYGELVCAAERVLLDNGFMPVIASYYNNPSYIRQHIGNFRGNRMAGMLLSTTQAMDMKRMEENQDDMPVVFFDQAATEGWQVPQVSYDYHTGGRLAARHLLSRGLTRLAFLVPSFDRASRRLLHQGIVEEMGEGHATLEVITAGEDKGIFSYRDYLCAADFFSRKILALEGRIDGLIVNNDMLAVTLLSRLLREGVRVPRDISIIGFDDIWLDELFVPRLTTVRQCAVDTGRAIAHMLLRLMENPDPSLRTVIEPQLVLGESVR